MEWIIVGIVAAILIIYLFLIFPAWRRHPDRVLMRGMYVAHRGLHSKDADIPENSLKAFSVAKQLGFCIEIDIHLTKDGKVVVFHDDNTARVCGEEMNIAEATLEQLKALRLAGTDEQIPTLQEVLSLVNGEVPLLIEFKAQKETCSALCAAADKILSGYRGKYFVQSFYPPVLGWYRKHRKDICRGQLATDFARQKGNTFEKWLAGWLLFNWIGRPDFISYDHRYTSSFGRSLCASLGTHSVCWTLHSEEQLAAVKNYYSTYIFEDFLPEKAYE